MFVRVTSHLEFGDYTQLNNIKFASDSRLSPQRRGEIVRSQSSVSLSPFLHMCVLSSQITATRALKKYTDDCYHGIPHGATVAIRDTRSGH